MTRTAGWCLALTLMVYTGLWLRYAWVWRSERALWAYTADLVPAHPLAVANDAIASHHPDTSFVYEDATWTQACHPVINKVEQPAGPRALFRSLAQWSWCLQEGQPAWAYRVVNLVLHLTVSALLGMVLVTVLESSTQAWVLAALFALHPLTVESAVYLGGRGELIAAVGVLLASLLALHRVWILAAAAVVVGLMGKESAIVAGVTIPLLLAVRYRLAPWVALVMALAVSVMALMASVIWQLHVIDLSGRMQWALLQGTAVVWLSVLSVLPLWQSPMHVYAGADTIQFWCLCGLIAMGVQAWTARATAPLLACGMGWILLTALPRLVVPTPPSVLNEHQWYVPLMGFTFIVADRLKVSEHVCDL